MKLKDFKKLLNKARIDKNGQIFLYGKDINKIMGKNYVIDNSNDLEFGQEAQKWYFGLLYTVCKDFSTGYCSYVDKSKKDIEYYNRHFTNNDDTLEIQIVRK